MTSDMEHVFICLFAICTSSLVMFLLRSQISVVARVLGKEGWTGGAQRIFRTVQLHCMTLIRVYICHYIFVQNSRMHNTKSEP